MKTKEEIINLKDEELRDLLGKLKDELFNLKLQLSLGQLANTSKKKEVRRNIARLLTEKRRREIDKEANSFGTEN